jgi:hypothetical protein
MLGGRRVVRMHRVRHRPQMLADMVEIHPLRARQNGRHQVPDPGRTVGHDQHFVGPAQAVTHRFGP